MNPQRWDQIEGIYQKALDCKPEDRRKFIIEACAEDKELLHEIESLLNESLAADGFMECPALELAAESLASDGTGSLVGRRLNHYEIVSKLGAGGMAEVYRARDVKLLRDVAIKVLPVMFAHDRERISRLHREAQLLASLNHPHIGSIYGLEEDNEVCALVLELVEGETLADRIGRSHVPVEEALEIARQIAEALEAAHARKIVHRDLKPANIKITPEGTVKVLDFGIARIFKPDESPSDLSTKATALTEQYALLGTASYMSPEQVRGEPVDFRSDQFSLGIILFEMLTRRRPFPGNSPAETLASVLRDAPPALRDLNSAIPSPVQLIVDRCLAKQPKDRYASTHDLARDLAMLGDRLARQQASSMRLGPSTLPASRTSLIGREEELAGACSLLLRDDVRLVTFTGTGGTGKTRLALQVAAETEKAFRGGIFFVALGTITDPSLVALTIAQGLGARDIGTREAADVLKEALRTVGEPVLLLLDNFEQVLDAAPLLSNLLESCSSLKILVTSRAVLRIYGEHGFEVPPLKLPSREARLPLETLARCPSVALFLQRAAAAKPDFALTEDNAAAIVEICAKLDGLPLAIELAAARARALTPKAMLQRLKSRFELLTGGARDLPERQQTLRATVEWSYGLLGADEQKLFRRLAVFVNGCSLEAVEAVCNAKEDLAANVLDGMESLAGKSLVQETQMSDGETRFTMLETIRDYALERLMSSPDEAVTRRAHAAYCLVLAEEGGAEITPVEREAWFDRCTLEHDNFRVALDWALHTKNAEWGLRLGYALYPFWVARSHYGEGRDRLTAMLKLPANDKAQKSRVRALAAAGDLTGLQGDRAAGRSLYEEALNTCRAIGDTEGVVWALSRVANDERLLGNLKSSWTIFEECRKLLQKAGNEPAVAQMLNNMAFLLQASGDFAGAKRLCEQALAIFVGLKDLSGVAWLQSRLGDLERQLGDPGAASNWYQNALATFESLGDRTGLARTKVDIAVLLFERGKEREARTILAQTLTAFRDLGNHLGIARALEEFANFAATAGKAERALRLAGAADAIRHSIGPGLNEGPALPLHRDSARQALGDAALAVEMDGWSMSVEAAIHYALEEETRDE